MTSAKDGGPYRESVPKTAVKEWWWLRVKRVLRAIVAPYKKLAVCVSLAALPAVVAHLAGVYSWHWIAAPALIVVVAASSLALFEHDVLAVFFIGTVVYIAVLVALRSATGKSIDSCVDEVRTPDQVQRCSHVKHVLTRFVHGGGMYVECRCER